jgi:transcriptional regulator with XRE-family HTH domain
MNLEKIGARIRKARKAQRLSMAEFAVLVGRHGRKPSQPMISRMERGTHVVPVDLLRGFSRVTGLPVERLRPDLAKVMRL